MLTFTAEPQDELMAVIRDLVIEGAARAPAAQAVELATIRANLDKGLNRASPLSSLGWDSVRMTWLLVRLEEHFDIDTSTISMFDLFTVGDLLDELRTLIDQKES